MESIRAFVRRYALAATLLLVAAASGLSVYAVSQVEAQRSASILRECQEQNARHTRTISQLDTLLAKAKKARPAKSREIQASRAPTVLLIDQLAPYQNCRRVLASSTSTR